MKVLSKTIGATVALAALTIGAATPALADRGRGHDDGISVGDVIAGAVIIGGIAAILGAGDNNDGGYYEGGRGYGYDDRGYNTNRRGHNGNRGNGRRAVEQCVAAVEQRAGGYANVTEIREVDRTRYGLRVKGRLEVQRGYGGRPDGGRFSCQIEQGRIVALDIDGIDNRGYGNGYGGGYGHGNGHGRGYEQGRGW